MTLQEKREYQRKYYWSKKLQKIVDKYIFELYEFHEVHQGNDKEQSILDGRLVDMAKELNNNKSYIGTLAITPLGNKISIIKSKDYMEAIVIEIE